MRGCVPLRPAAAASAGGKAVWLAAVLVFALPVAAEAPLSVRVVTAQSKAVMLHFELSGTIAPAEAVPMGFRSGGRIVSLSVRVGDRVAAGQVLAELDPTQAAAALRAARAQDGAAQAMLTQAEQARERLAELTARGAATQAALDAATEAALSARSAHDQAQAQLAKAAQALEDCTLRATAAGIVTARAAEPGQIVGAAQTVLTIARDGAREAVFYVPDFPALDRFLQREVVLRPVEGEGTTFTATVTEIAPLVAGETGSVRVTAQLHPTTPEPGLGTAVVSMVDVPYGTAMELPWTALVRHKGSPAVWRIDPDSKRADLAPVRVLRYTDHGVEIAEGLAEGAQVVSSGAHLLYPGRAVAPLEGGQ